LKQYEVIFAPEARDDLFALYDWIAAAASPDVALSYIERIETYCEYSTALAHLFHEHVASHSMTCGHPREVICEAIYL
jgi:plasmid stabilization system protein ParE